MTRFNIHGLGFTLFLALLTALPALSIDMALPSLALIQADFHAPQTEAAAAIAIFIAGFSSAPIVAGPLADRFGRRATMVDRPCSLHALRRGGGARALDSKRCSPFAWCKARAPARSASCRGRSSATCSRAARPACNSSAVSVVFGVAPLIAPALGGGDFGLRLLAFDFCRADRRRCPHDDRRASLCSTKPMLPKTAGT